VIFIPISHSCVFQPFCSDVNIALEVIAMLRYIPSYSFASQYRNVFASNYRFCAACAENLWEQDNALLQTRKKTKLIVEKCENAWVY